MTKKEIIKNLKKEFNSRLEKRVLSMLLSDIDNNNYEGTYQDKLEYVLDYYTSHGCSTGIVMELIYYSDTTKWFDNYKKEIIELVNDLIFNCCFNIQYDYETSCNYIEIEKECFKVKSNKIGQKKFDMYQKNALAWLSFEEIAYRIYNYYNESIKEA